MATTQNEDSLTVFWKLHDGSESFKTMRADLTRLAQRNTLLGETVLTACVDNCCQSGGKLKEIVPSIMHIQLDCFHWMTRWNDVVCNLKSEKTAMFRTLMRRAVFIAEDAKFQRAKHLLAGTNPTVRDAFKKAKATIPPADNLEPRVMSVLHHLMKKDAAVDLTRTTQDINAPKEARFFKPGAAASNTIVSQVEHVKKGCLSDPPANVVKTHRFNPTTKKTFTARSTGTNEADNRGLNRLLCLCSILTVTSCAGLKQLNVNEQDAFDRC